MTDLYLFARSYPPARFATLSSLLFGLGTLGDPLSGTPLVIVVGEIGWRMTMLGMAVVTAASLVCAAAIIRDPPRVEASGGSSPLSGLRQVLGIRALWPIFPLALVSYAVVASTRGLWIAPYLEQVHHLGRRAVGLGATGMGFAIATGGLLYAPLNRVIGNAKSTAVLGVSITVVGWLTLGLYGDRSAPLAIGLLLLCACFGASFAIVYAHARSFMPTHLLGLGVTMMNLVFFGGAGLSQWLSGRYVRAAELASVAPADLYGRLFTGFGFTIALALAIYLLAPPERR